MDTIIIIPIDSKKKELIRKYSKREGMGMSSFCRSAIFAKLRSLRKEDKDE